ncbi:MAG: acylphosphatase [Gemmatimonadaceae bacterium]|nr:acylphosphatase [Gemmatimonadaceae bacterium]
MQVVQAFRAFGRVQGVGFRWFVRERARVAGLTGWVRNEADGSVALIAAGTPAQLRQLEHAIREGPPGAHVQRLEVRTIAPVEDTAASGEPDAAHALSSPFQVVRYRDAP